MTENPLTQEQLAELNEISQLPVEEQKIKLNAFLQTLTPEQIDFLKKQQTSCLFCQIVNGELPTKKIYEDDSVVAVLDIHPATKGHVLLFPKKHYDLLALVPDVGHLFDVANKISKNVFELTQAEGTNIFVANGSAAGQKVPHVCVHIIPRFTEDKVQLSWKSQIIPEKELDELTSQLREKLTPQIEEKKEEPITVISIKQERRIP